MSRHNPFYKGHPGYYKGKLDKIDLIAFGNANMEYCVGIISKSELARRINVSVPTLEKYYINLCMRLESEVAKGNLKWTFPNKEGITQ